MLAETNVKAKFAASCLYADPLTLAVPSRELVSLSQPCYNIYLQLSASRGLFLDYILLEHCLNFRTTLNNVNEVWIVVK